MCNACLSYVANSNAGIKYCRRSCGDTNDDELPGYLIMPLPEIANDKNKTRMYFFSF